MRKHAFTCVWHLHVQILLSFYGQFISKFSSCMPCLTRVIFFLDFFITWSSWTKLSNVAALSCNFLCCLFKQDYYCSPPCTQLMSEMPFLPQSSWWGKSLILQTVGDVKIKLKLRLNLIWGCCTGIMTLQRFLSHLVVSCIYPVSQVPWWKHFSTCWIVELIGLVSTCCKHTTDEL